MRRQRAVRSYTHATTWLHPHGRNLRRNTHFDVCPIRMAEESLHRWAKLGFGSEVHQLYPEQASSPVSLGSTDPGTTW